MAKKTNPLVREWIRKGDHDLGMARLGLDTNSPFTDGICFHCQQAAEKYLKASLLALGVNFAKIHDIAALLDLFPEESTLDDQRYDEAEVLNRYAVEVRYPAGLPDPSIDEARDALAIAEHWRLIFATPLM